MCAKSGQQNHKGKKNLSPLPLSPPPCGSEVPLRIRGAAADPKCPCGSEAPCGSEVPLRIRDALAVWDAGASIGNHSPQVADPRQNSSTAPWRTGARKNWQDVVQAILRSGQRVNPLLMCAYVNLQVCRIDWLHAADMGVAADFMGSTLWLLQRKLPQPNQKERVAALWDQISAWYVAEEVNDRIRTLTVTMIKRDKKWPKLKMSAAHCRNLVPFVLQFAEAHCDFSVPEEEAACLGMRHLAACYGTLSSASIFKADILRVNSTKFANLYVGLAQLQPSRWRIKPKLHAWLEACNEGGDPATHWCYRDEDFGGSVASTGRRRGGACTVPGVSADVLTKFRLRPIARLRAQRA